MTFLCYKFNVNFYVDLTLLSIAIIFPLVFTIRGSFRRREKAMEHLSEFLSTIKTVKYFLHSNTELSVEAKQKIDDILVTINTRTLDHLASHKSDVKALDLITQEIYNFVTDSNNLISTKLKDRVFRFMKNMHESIENLHSIHSHRTPISLKAYCELFIYLFPFIYAPTIIYNIGLSAGHGVAYFVVILTQFILISLYNIQNQLEYPFDNIGMDDINLDNYRIER